MNTLYLDLNSVDKVKSFVSIVSKYDDEFELVSGKYTVNAKSILGIFSLDLSKPIEFRFYKENSNVIAELENYIVSKGG